MKKLTGSAESDTVFHKDSEYGSTFSPRVTITELRSFLWKLCDGVSAKTHKKAQNQLECASKTMRARDLPQ